MEPTHRATFHTCAEVIDRSIAYLTLIRNTLDTLRTPSLGERVAAMLEAIEVEERHARDALDRYREEAEPEALQTYCQFSVPLPEALPAVPESPSTDDVSRWALACNEPLIARFEELAQAGATDALREAFASMAEVVRNASKHITTAYDGLQDM